MEPRRRRGHRRARGLGQPDRRRPSGGSGVEVAVLDTGVAYSNRGRFRRSPDLSSKRFVKGYDFVDDDPWPNDENGHGTHVASTIAETANNGVAVVGVAYGARIMPVRVLDRLGEGDTAAIAAGIRYAAKHGAQVINLSFEFGTVVTRAEIPDILSALRYAHNRGALVVGAAGNGAEEALAYPAKSADVLSVGATTEHLCLADYSNSGSGLDVVAPGGGPDADFADDPDCNPSAHPGRDIYQMTFTDSVKNFGLPSGYRGTSMAAPHVSAVAALVIASGVPRAGSLAACDRGAAEGHRARPRGARLRHPLRRRAGQRRRGDRAVAGNLESLHRPAWWVHTTHRAGSFRWS